MQELRKLKAEVAKAGEAKVLAEDTVIDAEYEITKAIQEAKTPEPTKAAILGWNERSSHQSHAVICTRLAAGGITRAIRRVAAPLIGACMIVYPSRKLYFNPIAAGATFA